MKQKIYTTRREKIVDFIIGFVGLFILVVLTHLGITYLVTRRAPLDNVINLPPYYQLVQVFGEFIGPLMPMVPWVITIMVLVFFAFKRPWIAIGMVGAYAAAMVVGIIAQLFYYGGCF